VSRFFAAAMLLAGCEHDGRVLVVVDTDYDVPGELALIRARIVGSNGLEQSRGFDVMRRATPPHDDPAAVPLSFVIVPRESGSGDFEVEVTGHAPGAPDGDVLVSRRAITGFRPGHTLVLPLPLLRICERVVCPATLTCRVGVCVDARVPVEELGTVERPGQEFTDAGARDADRDALAPGDAGTCSFEAATRVLHVGPDDRHPSVTADELYLVYTSGDLIHYADRTMPSGEFTGRGALVLPGSVTPANPVISPDGLGMLIDDEEFVGSTTRFLYEMTRGSRGDDFGARFEINMRNQGYDGALDRTGEHFVGTILFGGLELTTMSRTMRGTELVMGRVIDELIPWMPSNPALSGDGLTLAFTSRMGASQDDIYLARRATIEGTFGPPELVTAISTPRNEEGPWLNDDASRLYFAREDTPGDWNIYVSERR
jgi:hypothetical protein